MTEEISATEIGEHIGEIPVSRSAKGLPSRKSVGLRQVSVKINSNGSSLDSAKQAKAKPHNGTGESTTLNNQGKLLFSTWVFRTELSLTFSNPWACCLSVAQTPPAMLTRKKRVVGIVF